MIRPGATKVAKAVPWIGGAAPRLRRDEAMAVSRAAGDGGALGASFYAWAESGPAEWRAMKAFSPQPPMNPVAPPSLNP